MVLLFGYMLLYLRNAVIANQSADWCGNPPDEWNKVTITTKNCSVSLSYRAIIDTFPL